MLEKKGQTTLEDKILTYAIAAAILIFSIDSRNPESKQGTDVQPVKIVKALNEAK